MGNTRGSVSWNLVPRDQLENWVALGVEVAKLHTLLSALLIIATVVAETGNSEAQNSELIRQMRKQQTRIKIGFFMCQTLR